MSKIVLGGGLSGLSAAYYALNKFPNEVITILEKSNRTGGWLKSTKQEDGSIFEQSARTIRPKGPAGANTLQLISELDLNHQVVPVSSNSPAALNRMIYVNGKLHTLPNSIRSIFKKQEPFSKPLFTYLLKDIVGRKKDIPEKDESLYSFINRRLGGEVADYLISPMVCGICGGDAKEISVKFLMKSLFENEQKYGSITRGVIADFFSSKNSVKSTTKTPLESRAMREKWNVYSFRNGIEVLPNAIRKNVEQRGVELKLNEDIEEIEIYKKSIVIHTKQGAVHVGNYLISSIPALDLGLLLKKHHPYLSEILLSFKTASMCVVNLQYNKQLLENDGFGFLVAPKENLPLLGVIYDTCCFPRENTTILTAMMGGYQYEKYFSSTTDEEVLEIALQQIKDILNISDNPDNAKVNILHNSIPQYVVGHSKKVNQIEDYLKSHNLAISVCGASYYGVGVNDVILSARKAVDTIG